MSGSVGGPAFISTQNVTSALMAMTRSLVNHSCYIYTTWAFRMRSNKPHEQVAVSVCSLIILEVTQSFKVIHDWVFKN